MSEGAFYLFFIIKKTKEGKRIDKKITSEYFKVVLPINEPKKKWSDQSNEKTANCINMYTMCAKIQKNSCKLYK